MRKATIIALFVFTISIFFNSYCAFGEENENNILTAKAEVIEIISTEQISTSSTSKTQAYTTQIVSVLILEGNHKDEVLELKTSEFLLNKGDEVIISFDEENKEIKNAIIYQFCRTKQITYLIGLFVLAMILVGGFKGLKALISLSFATFSVLFILPKLIISGYNPIFVTITIALIITIVTIFLINGINSKSYSAILGTLCGVLIAVTISVYTGTALKISGLVTEDQYTLSYFSKTANLDFRALLYSGILLGALGAVMDVCISISSVVHELKENNYRISAIELFSSAMNVGRDMIGSMSNTLILAYIGTSMCIVMNYIILNEKISLIINQEVVVTEILRALAGSIGLIISVPITAVIATIMAKAK